MRTSIKVTAGAIAALAATTALAAGDMTKLDRDARAALNQCREVSTSCATEASRSAGVLVFPEVVRADLIVGGTGGKGVLFENNKITGYYNIGGATAGLQAGIKSSNQVYVFRTAEALRDLKTTPEWKLGSTVDVAVINADAEARGTSGKNVYAYVFDSKGLHAGAALEALSIWKSSDTPPQAASR